MTADGKTRLPQWVGYVGWFLAAFFFFYAWVLRVSPSVMVQDLMRDFEVGGAVLGNLSAFYFYAYALLQMPAGVAHDRGGPRLVLSISALVTALGCLLFAFADDIFIAYLGRLLIGAGVAFAFVGSLVLAANWFPPNRFALLSGLGMTGGLLGGFAGQQSLGYFVAAEGWRDTMLWIGVVGLALGALTWLLTRDHPVPRPSRKERKAAAARSGEPSEPILKGLGQVLRRPQTLLIAGYAGFMSATMLAFGALWAVPFTMQVYDLDQAAASGIVSYNALGFAFGGPFWGWLSDRIRRRKIPMFGGCALALATLACLVYVSGLPLAGYQILLFVNGVAGGAMAVSYAVVRESNSGGMTGAALGLVNMMVVGSGALFQPIVGLLLDWQWDPLTDQLVAGARVYSVEAFQTAFLVLPAVYLLSLLCLAFIRETHCRPYGEPAPAAT